MNQEEDYVLMERYLMAIERIAQIPIELQEQTQWEAPIKEYFHYAACLIGKISEVLNQSREDRLARLSYDALRALNLSLYGELVFHYEESYANPVYCSKQCGEKLSPYLSFLYSELYGLIPFAYENRLFDLTITMELFLEIYQLFCAEEENLPQALKSAIYYYQYDYMEESIQTRVAEVILPTKNLASRLIEEWDHKDPRYLYQYGAYISPNEVTMAAYLGNLSDEKIDSMAATFVEGFRKGYENGRMDLSNKKSVQIRYPIGFERIVQAAARKFHKLGLSSIYVRYPGSLREISGYGFTGIGPSRQWRYDHMYDDTITISTGMNDRKLSCVKNAYETYRKEAKEYAGPACIEIFGETPFEPKNSKQRMTYSAKQQKLSVEYRTAYSLILNEFCDRKEYGFTIIAFPIPEIGPKFQEIFDATVRVNTLDPKQYEEIQQHLIQALDSGNTVKITGRNGNRTNLTVALQPISNVEKQTGFENCLADVNIPVGEVFTSPKLKGTNGILHIREVYLNDLRCENLCLKIVDGCITDYSCTNFDSGQENKDFVKQNLLYNHETLPMGEFAIGTNTTAYAMGQRYGISHLLPTLIAEKTGPHFAFGDTCYSMSEDILVYNPDGREMIAKENDYSRLRHKDANQAYFNCHTDLTIPYHELGDIIIENEEQRTVLIQEGRFVLPGTKALNEPLVED